MCGICGTFTHRPGSIPDLARLRDLRDRMTARGPDGQGEWASPDRRVWLGHRRLSIIDLTERGTQPMASADGRLVVTFNGEIYNYKLLRRDLEAEGHIFRSDSDTEVLLELYRAKGPAFVSLLRGMFAFALWDETRGSLLLARDPYGIKPLYYAQNGGRLTFASSVKALVGSGLVSGEIDPAGLTGFYLFGSVPEPWTIFRAVRALAAGTTLLIDNQGAGHVSRFHSIAKALAVGEANAKAGISADGEIVAATRTALLDSVRHHLVADVPVGAFLSAGIDSGALVGLMRDAGQSDIATITLTYDEFDGTAADEAPLAALVARHYGTRHHTRRVTAAEFGDDLPHLLAAMDQPSVDGVNAWFVAKAAREIGLKVAISGVGGDELFGGYDTFRRAPNLARRLALASRVPGGASLLEAAVTAARALGMDVHPKHAALLRYGGTLPGAWFLLRGVFLPGELATVGADPEFIREGLAQLDPLNLVAGALGTGQRSDFGKVAALESVFYLRNQLLRDTDWASMAHSLEVRTPLVDHVLLGRLAPIALRASRSPGKTLLADAPSRPLPAEITTRRKTGFGIPIESWLKRVGMVVGSLEQVQQPFSRHWARHVAKSHLHAAKTTGTMS